MQVRVSRPHVGDLAGALLNVGTAMRNLALVSGLLLAASACNGGPTPAGDPPTLTITAPQRSLIQTAAGTITVTGTVVPSAMGGAAITSVMVNDVSATLAADGSFTANVQVEEGATLIHTVATDASSAQATDTRSVEAGANKAPGAMIGSAVTAAISKQAFAKIASAAGPIIQSMNMQPLLAPLQPMYHAGDEDGPDCLYGEMFVNNLTTTKVSISLVPVAGGLQFSAELDGLDVPGQVKYAVACLGGTDNTDIKATSVVVAGTLLVSPDGNGGFTTNLQSPTVNITGLDISSGGLPGDILDILPLDSAIETIAPLAANMFMGPMVNDALGALGGPKTLNLLGTNLTVNVLPSAISFTSDAGVVALDMSLVIGGAEGSKGFTSVTDGSPTMNAGAGMQLGLADNLANDLLAQAVAMNLVAISMPTPGGTFDTTSIAMTSPPMISGNTSDGKMALVLPDMTATFLASNNPVAQAAINASVELAIAPSSNGLGVGLELGTPTIDVDVLNTVANQTHFTSDDLSDAVKLSLQAQITTFSALLSDIPLPALAGIQLTGLSIGADSGYVMLTAQGLQ
jgi:Glucodextranase, domain B